MERDPRSEALFLIVVTQFRDAALLSLGKADHPLTGKKERNLEAARLHIDILAMLQEKTEGHLGEVESLALQSALTDLRILYVEEKDKGDQPEGSEAEAEKGADREAAKDQRKEQEGVAKEGTSGEGREGEEERDAPPGD